MRPPDYCTCSGHGNEPNPCPRCEADLREAERQEQDDSEEEDQMTDHQTQAAKDAKLVGEFLRRQRDHWSKRADEALTRGSMGGAMQYHGYDEVLDEARSRVTAFNGKDRGDGGYPCVTLAECADALGFEPDDEEPETSLVEIMQTEDAMVGGL